MNRLRFLWAKLRGDEAALASLSLPEPALFRQIDGRRVALVGNARSLAEGRHGPQIDAADIVIRLNAAPMPSAESHGTRTDWLAVSVPPDPAVLQDRRPEVVLWMTRKRRRLPHALATAPGFFLNAPAAGNRLAEALGAPPTTGLMAIDLLVRSPAAAIDLYGFDFFASLSLSGRRTAAQVPHDFAAEAAWVEDRTRTDPRLRLVR